MGIATPYYHSIQTIPEYSQWIVVPWVIELELAPVCTTTQHAGLTWPWDYAHRIIMRK